MHRLPSAPCLLVVLLLAALSTGCATRRQSTDSFLGFLTPYRIDIVQGNAITREQAERVKPGMTRTQVREVLGTPLIADIFHGDRWDYIFTIRRPRTDLQRRSVVVLFDGDTLKSIDAPDLPTEQEFVASISSIRLNSGRAVVLQLTEDERKALPAPVRKPLPPPEPTGPVRDYPALDAS